MKKIFAILLTVCAISVVLSGCSGGDSAPADGGTKTETAGGTAGTEGK